MYQIASSGRDSRGAQIITITCNACCYSEEHFTQRGLSKVGTRCAGARGRKPAAQEVAPFSRPELIIICASPPRSCTIGKSFRRLYHHPFRSGDYYESDYRSTRPELQARMLGVARHCEFWWLRYLNCYPYRITGCRLHLCAGPVLDVQQRRMDNRHLGSSGFPVSHGRSVLGDGEQFQKEEG